MSWTISRVRKERARLALILFKDKSPEFKYAFCGGYPSAEWWVTDQKPYIDIDDKEFTFIKGCKLDIPVVAPWTTLPWKHRLITRPDDT